MYSLCDSMFDMNDLFRLRANEYNTKRETVTRKTPISVRQPMKMTSMVTLNYGDDPMRKLREV